MLSDHALMFSCNALALSDGLFTLSDDAEASSNGALAVADSQVHNDCNNDTTLVLSSL